MKILKGKIKFLIQWFLEYSQIHKYRFFFCEFIHKYSYALKNNFFQLDNLVNRVYVKSRKKKNLNLTQYRHNEIS